MKAGKLTRAQARRLVERYPGRTTHTLANLGATTDTELRAELGKLEDLGIVRWEWAYPTRAGVFNAQVWYVA